MNIDVKLAAGKTTATPVTNKGGGTLLPADFELNEKIIAALVKQGIEMVEVFDAEENRELDIINKKKIERIDLLFQAHNSTKMNELKECLINQIEN